MSFCKRLSLGAMMAAMAVGTAWAVPAKPTPVQVTQPDGTVITVQLRGDERSHFVLTEDNYLAVEKNGYYYYGNADAQGQIVASDLRVMPKAKRTAADRAYLQTVDMPRVFKALEARAEKAVKARPGMGEARQGAKAPAHATQANPDHIGLFPGTHFPAMGEQKGLVVLVEYTDVKFKTSYEVDAYDYFNRMCNEPGFSTRGGTGSARDFFMQNSRNQFKPDFDVYGPITLSKNMAYYGGNDWFGNDQHPEEMVIEACQQLDDIVDFSQYDRDGDGYIDNVFVFYAGQGEASGGSDNTVWPHSWDVTSATSTPYYFDGVRLDRYACSNEWEGGSSGHPDGVGTFIHEFSHVMGIPDLYATSYTSAFTPGEWSAMDYGPYNNDGRTPPNYSIYERYSLGWIEPTVIDGPLNGRLTRIDQSNQGYIIPTSKDTEFFLLENRQQNNWDAYIPGHGMLIWHIDYNTSVWNSNTVNNTASHQYVDLEEANNSQSDYARAGNPFPGTSNKTSFTDDTSPNMKTWSGQRLNLPITDIAESAAGVITFKVAGGRPEIQTPVGQDATDITAIGFTAHWAAVEGATGYYLSVYSIDETITDPGKSNVRYVFNHRDVGNVTEYAVDGLQPETTYYYKVSACDEYGESDASAEISVTTGEPTFDFLAPVATDATDTTTDAFTATWEAMEGATEYFLTVYTKTVESYIEDVVDFTGGLNKLPAGWTTTSKLTYSMASYCGESAPSLRLAQADASITSPTYNADVLRVTFWHRGSKAPEANKIAVYAMIGSSWRSVASLDICNEAGGQTVTVDMPVGARSVRIEYAKIEDAGSVAIDDIVVAWNPDYSTAILEGYDGVSVGDALSAEITGLDPKTTYYYYVTATDGEYTSLPSNEIAITTDEVKEEPGDPDDPDDPNAGISNATVGTVIRVLGRSVEATEPVEVYTLDGRRVGQRDLAPGIYVARTATRTVKVVVR